MRIETKVKPAKFNPNAMKRHGEMGSARFAALFVAIALALIIVFGARYFGLPRTGSASPGESTLQVESQGSRALSSVTMNALASLQSPVEIRFYAQPVNTRGSEGMSDFIDRVDQLLSNFRQHGRGLVRITRFDSSNGPNIRNSATADGIEPLGGSSRDPGYLGLAIICDDQKVSIPKISPEWEQALEFDLTRAILRVTDSKAASASLVDTTTMDSAAVAEVRRAIPSVDSVSFDEGYQVLHSAALEDFRTVVTSMDARLKQAQQRVKSAQDSGSDTQLRAALEDLQKLQSEQTGKLQEIADSLQKQTKALQQLKGSAQ